MSPSALKTAGLTLCLVAGLALAHIWTVSHGVHFKGANIDFGKPPRRYGLYWNDTGLSDSVWRAGTDYLGLRDGQSWEERPRRASHDLEDAGLKRALALEEKQRYRQALNIYRRLNAIGENGDFIMVRKEVLALAARKPAMKGLRAYLKETRPVGQSFAVLSKQCDPLLDPYILYSRAMHDSGRTGHFELLARRFPNSKRAEAALIMVPRRLLAENLNGAPISGLDDKCRRSSAALATLLSRYPHSRFRAAALGWQGRIEYLKEHFDQASRLYQKQLLAEKPGLAQIRALDSLAMAELAAGRPESAAIAYAKRFRMAPASDRMLSRALLIRTIDGFAERQANRFVDLLLADEEAFPVYFDLRLDTTEHTESAQESLAGLAIAWCNRHPRLRERSFVLARVAEIQFADARYRSAARIANRVLAGKGSVEARALAHYILGSCARRFSRYPEAIRNYEAILGGKRCYLSWPAREALAVIFEKQGRLTRALDEYFRLGYEWDVAYLLDAKMTPKQVAGYAALHSAGEKGRLLRYSAGIRYLRIERWREARNLLLSLTSGQRRDLAFIKQRGGARELYYDSGLQDPLEVLNGLQKLSKRVTSAKGGGERVRALLSKAQFYYAHRNLALYNAALWTGYRAYNIGFSWNNGLNGKEDDEALRRHHYEHECMAHSLAIVGEILKSHPRSSVAPQATYLGIKCGMRLATLNPWWRAEEARADHYGQALLLCRRFLRDFPKHSLAKTIEAKVDELQSLRLQRHADALQYPRKPKEYPGF